MVKRRFEEIEVMRIIGFLMVVDQHILGGYAQRVEASFADSMVLYFLHLLGRPAVPMFVAITGFTLFYTNYNNINIKEFYRKRLATIVIPYLFWTFASIIFFNEYSMFQDIIPVLMTGFASYHLWYMAMSIRLYIWFPVVLAIISWIIKKKEVVQRVAFAIFCVGYWLILKEMGPLTNGVAEFFFGAPSFLEKRFIGYSPIFYSIYLICGIVVCLKYERFKEFVLKHSKKIITAYVPLVIYMYYTQICNSLPGHFPRISYEHALYILYMLQTTVVVYIISLNISKKAGKLKSTILDLGALSYGAYLIHVIVLQLVAPMFRRWVPIESYLISGIIIFIITCIISFAMCYLIRLTPLSKYIIGVKPIFKAYKMNGINKSRYIDM
jgi:probable poly-beta-1,6-N-acetyl-D-glucosamine export protein